jgi:sec-independent protein translocase protein TatA
MFGSGELIVILCVALLLFGGKKLPEFARNLGKGIREFKKAINETEDLPEAPEIPSVKLEKKAAPESENSDTQ